MESLVHGMLSNAAAVTVLAVVVALAGRLGRRPALVHSLCLLAMLKLVTPPIVSLPLPMPRPADTTQSAIPAEPVLPDDGDFVFDMADAGPAESPPLPEDLGGDWLSDEPARLDGPENPISAAAWSWEAIALGSVLAGALAWWALAAARIARFHRLLRDVEPMPAEWRDETDELAARLGLRHPPTTCLVPGDVPPMLWALGPRVRLLVPARLWATLTDDERTSLLLHELAHLRRRDHWVRWAELAVAGLYWWHPAVWWIRRALREAEEQCCDAWVVWAMPGGARTYAAALVAALEFVSGARTAPAAAASATLGSGHVSSLKRRLRMIVRAKTPKGLSWAGRLAVACLSALLLPLAPSWGQKDNPPSAYADLDRQARSTDEAIKANLALIDAQAALDVAQARLARSEQDEPKRGDGGEPKQAKPGEGEPKKESRSREASERIERELRELKEKLGKDLDPVGDAVRRSLERALDEIQQALNKEGMTAEDLRRAVEKSRGELHKSLQRGGPVEKQMREAAERARKDMQEAMKRSMQDAEGYREAMKARMQEVREQQKKRQEEMAEQHRKASEEHRKAMEAAREERRKAMEERMAQMRRAAERQREAAQARARREQEEGAESQAKAERPKAEEKPEAGGREKAEPREDMESARREIRELRARLEAANRRLERLQRRDSRRPEPPAQPSQPEAPRAAEPPARPATPETPARLAEPRRPEAPARPAPPRRPATPARPAEPRQPASPGRPAQPSQPDRARGRDDYERRFRDLEDKMDRLLRELEQMRRQSAPGTRAILSR
jgi:beta-lactamase regulating signal transducer with metallopeptidase domain